MTKILWRPAYPSFLLKSQDLKESLSLFAAVTDSVRYTKCWNIAVRIYLHSARGKLVAYGSINIGIPFTKRPKALMLDLKTRVSPEKKVTKALGFGTSIIDGHDEPEIYVYLQKRWEDAAGNIYAKRIATCR